MWTGERNFGPYVFQIDLKLRRVGRRTKKKSDLGKVVSSEGGGSLDHIRQKSCIFYTTRFFSVSIRELGFVGELLTV